MIRSSTCKRLAGAVVALVGLASAPALAQEGRDDPAGAEVLFTSARELVSKGDWAAGCPKFEASLALHPSASTMIHIAQCHEHDGKIATAWEDYARALVLNHETQGADRQQALEAIAQKGRLALEPRLPRLRIVVGRAPAGLEVMRDGLMLAPAALGEALPANPGPHEVRARAPGFLPQTRTAMLQEGATTEVALDLVPAPAVEPAVAAPPPPPPPVADAPRRGGVPVWAWVTGGTGLVLAGVGAFFLSDDLSAISALRSNCHTDSTGTRCNAGYDWAHDNARKDRDLPLSIAFGGAGIVAVGAAVVGIATAPRASGPQAVLVAPWVGASGAGVTAGGRF